MAGRYDLEIRQGASFRREITWQADGVTLDLTTYTARAMVRADVDDATPKLTLTTENGRITLSDGVSPTYNILLTVTPAVTAALTDWGKGVWDLELVSAGGTVTRLLEGKAALSKEVSR